MAGGNVDSSGNIYVYAQGGSSFVYITKFDSLFNQLWTAQISASSSFNFILSHDESFIYHSYNDGTNHIISKHDVSTGLILSSYAL